MDEFKVINKPILVTGSPRSGTSWVGRMIEQEPFVRYVHEPFNISRIPCRCGVNFEYWFQYLSLEILNEFREHLGHTIYPAYTWIGLLNTITEMVQSKRIRPLSKYFETYLPRRVVVKGPLAIFSAETLAHLFEMDVVVLIRHPAAIVSSYKDLNWTHPFSHFLNQPELIEEQLSPFRHEIEDFANNEYDIVDQIALLWKLIHYKIANHQETHPNWIFLRYEDLALNPIEEYRTIFQQLDLPFSDHTYAMIQSHNMQQMPSESFDPYSIKQNPRQVISKWRDRLTTAEIARIRERVEDVSSVFYSDDEW